MTFPAPNTTSTAVHTGNDWCVLVLWADDSESDLRGLWGPFTNFDIAGAALEELRQWPLDGRWDVRRLNKFVAQKSGTQPDTLSRAFTWNYERA